MAATGDTDSPLLGQTLGRFRVERLVGAGSMGQVFLGTQPTIGSRVAIKVLSRECAENRTLVERFFNEARVEVFSTSSSNSRREKLRPRWRCSLKQALELARAEGAPKGNLVAKVSWLWDGWYFDYGKTSLSVKDGCPSDPPGRRQWYDELWCDRLHCCCCW